jgi:hypothetical protein
LPPGKAQALLARIHRLERESSMKQLVRAIAGD